MRKEQFNPRISDRENRTAWEEAGSQDARARADRRAKEILGRTPEPVLESGLRSVLLKEITGLKAEIMDLAGEAAAA